MPLPRPRVLTRFTLDEAKTLRFAVDDAGSYDADIDVTVAAGDYYVSGDQQDDDILQEIMAKAYTAFVASGVTGYDGANANGKPMFWIDGDGKVNAAVAGVGTDPIRIKWTEQDGADIASILGFDSSADTDLESSSFEAIADYQHAYGWYATEDGQLDRHDVEDGELADVLQSVAPSGHARTQFLDSRFDNVMSLTHLTRAQTFSGGAAYESAPSDPYDRNVGLDCWWQAAKQGVEFRIYTHHSVDTQLAEVGGTADSGSATTLGDSGKSFDTDPQKHAGKVLHVASFTRSNPMRFYIASHTGTVLTVANSVLNQTLNGDAYHIFDQRYRTYIVDLNRMQRFRPKEIDGIDRYDVMIPLLRYEA